MLAGLGGTGAGGGCERVGTSMAPWVKRRSAPGDGPAARRSEARGVRVEAGEQGAWSNGEDGGRGGGRASNCRPRSRGRSCQPRAPCRSGRSKQCASANRARRESVESTVGALFTAEVRRTSVQALCRSEARAVRKYRRPRKNRSVVMGRMEVDGPRPRPRPHQCPRRTAYRCARAHCSSHPRGCPDTSPVLIME